jgi:hypothetical protein
MSPIDVIKRGILNGDWQDVCAGYSSITGDSSLRPPASDVSLLSKLQKLVGEYSLDTKPVESEAPVPTTVDEELVPKEDTSYLPKKTAEKRPAAKFVTATCAKCFTKQELPESRAIITIGDEKASFVCNDCIVRKKKG